MAGADARDGRVWKSYQEYFRAAPEIVFEWNDRETAARGWLVINSLKGGAAGGGTRMRAGLTRAEVRQTVRRGLDAGDLAWPNSSETAADRQHRLQAARDYLYDQLMAG